MGVTPPVSEILLLSKTANFPFLSMDYSPWSSKNSIDQNRLKKLMQVVIDVKYRHTNFGGCGLSGFGDIAISKTAKFPFLSMDYSPWSSKNLIDRNRLKKFMQVVIDVKCMPTNFSGRALPSFGDIATFKNGHFPLSEYGLYSPWSSKNSIDQNWPKNICK